MIFLAHDKTIPDSEISGMCAKSCQNGFSGMMGGADSSSACQTGCREQALVFKKHGLDDHGAKMSVVHGLGVTPEMHSEAPFHHRIFAQMREMHERMLKAVSSVKHAVIQRIQIRIHALPPGPDGKPRYQVEIQQHRVPIVFGRPNLPFGGPNNTPSQPAGGKTPLLGGGDHDKKMHHQHGMNGNANADPNDELSRYVMHSSFEHGGSGKMHPHRHHGHEHQTVMFKVRHFFTDMSEPAKAALRWSLFGLLIASVLCLGWLCFRTCRRAAHRGAVALPTLEKPRLSLTPALIKRKPSVQSGDIFYVDVSDKKPLIEDKDEA